MEIRDITYRNLRDDVLLVTATLALDPEDGVPEATILPIKAFGWRSALTNHFAPEDYQEDGHRKEGATSRAMTDAERDMYARRLLTEQAELPAGVYWPAAD